MMEVGVSEIYERIGGAEGLRALVDSFYDHMDREPFAAPIRAMHPPDLQESRDKLFDFLSGWMGGPPLYAQKRGHPMLRARHLPFPVDLDARDQWMACMVRALHATVADPELREILTHSFLRVADHMRNQPEG